MGGIAGLSGVFECERGPQSYWEQAIPIISAAEERNRLAMAYVGPVLERIFVATKIKHLELVPAEKRGKEWGQMLTDHAGRTLMRGDNAWQVLSECCRLYRYESVLEDAIRDFPEAPAVLSAGYFRASMDCDQVGLQVYLPFANTYATWPI